MLVLLCYMKLATFFCIEIPSGLQGTIIRVFKITAKEYNLLFSAYTWPDIVMSIVGGIVIDRVIGVRAGYLIATVVAIVGKATVTMGAFVDSFYVIVAGRFIMGCGVGSMKSVGAVFLSLWFKDKEIAFAMSISLSCARFGAASGLLVPQFIYDNLDITQYFGIHGNHYQVGFTFFFGFICLFSSLFVCLFIVLLDTKGAKALGRAPFMKRRFQAKDLKDFSLKFWISVVSVALFYAVLYVFVANGQLFFTSRFGLSINEANIANFLVFSAPVFITPIIGFLVDVLGFNVLWGISGLLIAILTHILFNIVSEQFFIPYILASLFSFSYSLFSVSIVFLPAVIVQAHQLTTGFGLSNTAYCLIFTSTSVIAGIIIDNSGYIWLEIFYVLLLGVTLLLLITMVVMELFENGKNDRKVNKAGWWLSEHMHSKLSNLDKKRKERTQEDLKETLDDVYNYD